MGGQVDKIHPSVVLRVVEDEEHGLKGASIRIQPMAAISVRGDQARVNIAIQVYAQVRFSLLILFIFLILVLGVAISIFSNIYFKKKVFTFISCLKRKG